MVVLGFSFLSMEVTYLVVMPARLVRNCSPSPAARVLPRLGPDVGTWEVERPGSPRSDELLPAHWG